MPESRAGRKPGITYQVSVVSAQAVTQGLTRQWFTGMQIRAKNNVRKHTPLHNYAKRPLRPHPGTHLKNSIETSKIQATPFPKGAVLYGAVSSSKHYAYFVDQGTKPFMAKVLPPWAPGSPTLFEHTWTPPGSQRPVGEKLVRGQDAQKFFMRGLDDTMRGTKLTGTRAGLSMASVLAAWPHGLESPNGSTTAAPWRRPGFQKRLEEWREWRDTAVGEWMREQREAKAERKLPANVRAAKQAEKQRQAEEAAKQQGKQARKAERARQETKELAKVGRGLKPTTQQRGRELRQAYIAYLKGEFLAEYGKSHDVKPLPSGEGVGVRIAGSGGQYSPVLWSQMATRYGSLASWTQENKKKKKK